MLLPRSHLAGYDVSGLARQVRPAHHVPVPERITYLGVARDLEERIRAGEYPPGTPLPPYKTLARTYSVGVTTVQRALQELKARGLVEGRQGKAVYVIDRETK